MSAILAFVIVALTLWAFVLFNRNMFRGEKPNTASWNLWVLLTVVNTSSYFSMNGDLIKLSLPLTDAALCLVTWILALFLGRFQLPPRRDYIPIGLAIGALIIWNVSSAGNANIFTQLPLIISFVPYFTHARNGEVEARPWVIWTLAFVLNIVLVSIRNSNRNDFIYPILGMVLHGAVALIALINPRKPQISERH